MPLSPRKPNPNDLVDVARYQDDLISFRDNPGNWGIKKERIVIKTVPSKVVVKPVEIQKEEVISTPDLPPVAEDEFSEFTIKQLKSLATAKGLDLPGGISKSEIIALLKDVD